MRSFYLIYGKGQTVSDESKSSTLLSKFENQGKPSSKSISETMFRELKQDEFVLSWSHYLKLMRIDNENERKFYEIESLKNNWSVRELERQ